MSNADIAHKKKRSHHSRQSGGQPSLAGSVVFGMIWFVVLTVLLLFLFTLIIYSTSDPGRLVPPAALSALYISAFVGGLFTAIKNKGDALVCGLLSGSSMFLMLIIMSLILPTDGSSGFGFWTSLGLHALIIPFSLLGAFAGVSLLESGKRRRRGPRRQR